MHEIHILLVDDNEGDILLTKEALEEAKIVNRISVDVVRTIEDFWISIVKLPKTG